LRLTPKQLGEIAEAEFIAKGVGLRFVVAKPWGDSESYDYIVNARRSFNFWRVQVKSAHVAGEDGTYSFRAHDHAQRSYSAKDIDALVAYARPIGAWYVFPVRVVERLKGLKLYPRAGRSGRSMRSIARRGKFCGSRFGGGERSNRGVFSVERKSPPFGSARGRLSRKRREKWGTRWPAQSRFLTRLGAGFGMTCLKVRRSFAVGTNPKKMAGRGRDVYPHFPCPLSTRNMPGLHYARKEN
jgi:hypothetical protein